MQSGNVLRRASGSWLAVVALLAVLAAPTQARPARPGVDGLSPRLTELAKPSVRASSPAKQASDIGLPPTGPGSLQRDGGRVLVEVRFDRGAAARVAALRAAGAEVVSVSRRYQSLTVAAKPADLEALAAVPGVEGVTEALRPIVSASPEGCPSGTVVSEGDAQLRAAEARSEFGVDGSGVTVGILSDSYDRDGGDATNASGDVSTGDLPGSANPCGDTSPVNVLDDSDAAGADEGRAMAQIVHDLAPGAKLAFATAFFNDQLPFAENIERLARPTSAGGAGASVIADDVSYFDEPFFQDGPVAVAVDKVTAQDVSYFSSAGNNNIILGGKNVASWQGQYQASGGCPAGVPHYLPPDQFDCTDFNGSGDTGFGITVKAKGSLLIDLQWAEPWYGVDTDFDAYLLNGAHEVVEESEYNNPGATQKPFELLFWKNPASTAQTVELAIKRYSGSGSPPLKLAMLENGAKDVIGTEYPESTAATTVGPTIFGHSAAAGALSVAAVPYSSESEPEYYSSRGPVSQYFGPVNGVAPAAELASPETRDKPDLAATDCGQTTFFAFEAAGAWRFCGTSASAPHAAAVAALMRDADPALTPAQIRAALVATSRPVGVFGAEAVGSGLLDAVAALGEVAEPGEPAPEEEPVENGGSEESEGSEEGGAVSTSGESPTEIDNPAPPGVSKSTKAVAPNTFFRRHPPKLIRTRGSRAAARFRFGSDENGVTFSCRIDGGQFRLCPATLVRRFSPGSHVVGVVASDAAGNRDRSPATYRFTVRTVR